MPTGKKRIHITVDDETYAALGRLSATRGQSVVGVGLSLIEQALEFQEDLHFSRISDERLKTRGKRIAHDTAWPSLRIRMLLPLILPLAITACEGPRDTGSGFELEETTIVEVQEALLTGQTTTVELVESYLRRIQAYNGQCVEQPAGLLGPIVPIANAGQINALSTLNLRHRA